MWILPAQENFVLGVSSIFQFSGIYFYKNENSAKGVCHVNVQVFHDITCCVLPPSSVVQASLPCWVHVRYVFDAATDLES